MYVLLLCSIVCLAVVIERAYAFWSTRSNVELLIWRLREYIPKGRLEEAKSACLQERGPIAEVALVALENAERPREFIESAVERAMAVEEGKLTRYLPALATIGVVAPLLGLFGTVLGIMDAFRSVAREAAAGPTVVAAGVAEALITTAFGLAIGIGAYVAYNYFVSAAGRMSERMEVVASEVLDLLAQMPGAFGGKGPAEEEKVPPERAEEEEAAPAGTGAPPSEPKGTAEEERGEAEGDEEVPPADEGKEGA